MSSRLPPTDRVENVNCCNSSLQSLCITENYPTLFRFTHLPWWITRTFQFHGKLIVFRRLAWNLSRINKDKHPVLYPRKHDFRVVFSWVSNKLPNLLA